MPTATRASFFTPEFLAQLERLSLLSRRSFRGSIKGERRSPRRGHSVEFADYRAYGHGDDLRYVDWNIYGRLERLHVKLFVDEEDLCLHLVVDASASMTSATPSKLDYAVRVAAALGFVGLANHERVGVGVLRERVAEGWPPTRGRAQILPMMNFLGDVRPPGPPGSTRGWRTTPCARASRAWWWWCPTSWIRPDSSAACAHCSSAGTTSISCTCSIPRR